MIDYRALRPITIGIPSAATFHQVDTRTHHQARLLTPAECDRIVTTCRFQLGGNREHPANGGHLTAHPVHNPDAILGADITMRIWHAANRASQLTFGWNIPIDNGQFGVSCYHQGDYMAAHVDDEERDAPPWDLPHRGISMSIPLTSGHQGGQLRLRDAAGGWVTATAGQGDALMFGSSLEHEVLPVTRGPRWVLLAWVYVNHHRRGTR